MSETSHMGPGAHDGHLKLFGSEMNNHVTMGSKYEFKPLGTQSIHISPYKYRVESGHDLT